MNKFEIGKYYEHQTQRKAHICGIVETIFYGVGYLAEDSNGSYTIFGMKEENTIGWNEITKKEYLK